MTTVPHFALPPSLPSDTALAEPPCPNCGTPLVGPYCHQCGQRRPAPDDLTVHRFGAALVHEVADVDSTHLRTLRALLLTPGSLTEAFVAGRRTRYLSPVRLYLTVSAIYFGFAWRPYLELQRFREQLAASLAQVLADLSPVARTRLIDSYVDLYGYTRFATVTLLPLVLLLLLRRYHRGYVHYFIFALHYYAFDFAFYTVLLGPILLLQWAHVTVPPAALFGLLPVHVWWASVAVRRVYGASSTRAVALGIGVVVADLVVNQIAQALLGIAAYLSVH